MPKIVEDRNEMWRWCGEYHALRKIEPIVQQHFLVDVTRGPIILTTWMKIIMRSGITDKHVRAIILAAVVADRLGGVDAERT